MIRPTNRRRHPLAREIAVVLLFKVLALAALYGIFFGPSQRPAVTPEVMERVILGVHPAAAPAIPSPVLLFRAAEPRRNDRHV